MAFVAITKALREDVKRFIDKRRDIELTSVSNPYSMVHTVFTTDEFRKHLVDKLWEPYAHLREQTEKYSYPLCVNVKPGDHGDYTPVDIENAPCFINRHESQYFSADGSMPGTAELLAAYEAWHECCERWGGIADQVDKFLAACKSLNEALKLWPDVAAYVPKNYLDRVNSKSEKKRAEDERQAKAVEALRAIDLEKIRTSETLVRLNGGQGLPVPNIA